MIINVNGQNVEVDDSFQNLPDDEKQSTVEDIQRQMNVHQDVHQEQQQNQLLLGEINNFSQKVDYFEEARPAMIQLLQSGMASSLEDAYEKAIRLTPELFESHQKSLQAQAEESKRNAANNAAKKARAAAVSVKGSTPGTVTNTKAQDRRSLLAEQFDNISDRF